MWRTFCDCSTIQKVMASFDVASFDRRNIEQWFHRNLTHQADHGYGLFSVLLRQSGKLIGNCGLTLMLLDGVLIIELGYEFNSKYWNQGYATEAAVAVRDFAFRQLHLQTITSLVRVRNLAAMRVSEKNRDETHRGKHPQRQTILAVRDRVFFAIVSAIIPLPLPRSTWTQ
ncbi:MAG TPA: GNAT family N-acetyltransferase [Candidatus Angelobacter sp.]|nr:GNAT family N-acetyltransferase [Candidatus Angelobacter sp.]